MSDRLLRVIRLRKAMGRLSIDDPRSDIMAQVIGHALHELDSEETDAYLEWQKSTEALVFKHEIDPSYGEAEHQAKLSEIHETAKKAQKTAEEAKAEAEKAVKHPPTSMKDVPIRC